MKRIVSVILVAVLCLTFASALAAEERVYDQAGLFSSGEISDLNRQITAFQQETDMDFVILTSDQPHDGASQQQICDEFFLKGGFGMGEDSSGILYYIDMDERYHYLCTHGAMIDYMNTDRIDDAIERCTTYLASGDYGEAASHMIGIILQNVKEGIPEGQYRYDVVTGQMLTARHKALTSGEILLSGLIGLIVCLAFVMIVKSRYKLKGSTYQYDYSENTSLNMTDREDTYLRTTTTRTRKPDPPQNNGGDGSGSGVHSGSDGSSFGGGGGHF